MFNKLKAWFANDKIHQKQVYSALFTALVYTVIFNWKIALLLMASAGFHEYSHLFAARKLGMKSKGFFLVPFVGGVALVGDRYKTLWNQAIVVIAGPFGGFVLAAVTAGVYLLTGIQFLAASATWMCMLNLFNLFPFSFMDGGQLLGTLTYSINRTLGLVCTTISTVVAVVLLLWLSPIIGSLILIVGGYSLYKEIMNWKHYRNEAFYLCSVDYLFPPYRQTKLQMAMTVVMWSLTAGLLIGLVYAMSIYPAADPGTLFVR